MERVRWLVLIVLVMAGAVSAQDAVWQATDCSIEIPDGVDADCGTVMVTEDRQHETGSLEIAFVRYHTDVDAGIPTVLLAGGPGLDGIGSFGAQFDERIAPFLRHGDVIIFDQRGTGLSGELRCSEGEGGARFDVPLPYQRFLDIYTETITDCLNRLSEQGVNLAAYNSRESASDVVEMMTTLGYETVNLYGISYGTRLAQTIMRDHTEHVNAVILDAAIQVDVDQTAEGAAAFAHAMETLYAACDADAACAAVYPELEGTFYRLYGQLEMAERTIIGVDVRTGATFPIALNEKVFTGIVFNALYTPENIRRLPAAIYGMLDGDYSLLGEIAGWSLSPSGSLATAFADGMQYAVNCNDEVRFADEEAVEASIDRYPVYAYPLYTGIQTGERIISVCDNAAFAIMDDDRVEMEPIVSDIPTLILAGEFDMITPTYWSEAIVETLSQGTLVIFPGLAHGTLEAGTCPQQIVDDFLSDPMSAPDTDCVADMSDLDFEVRRLNLDSHEGHDHGVDDDHADEDHEHEEEDMHDDDHGHESDDDHAEHGETEQDLTLDEIVLETVTTESGWTVVVPEGWTATGDEEGNYESPGGVVSLTQQVIAAPSPLFVMPVVQAQTGLRDPGEGEAYRAGEIDWTVYGGVVDGIAFDIAIASGDGVYLVLVATPEALRERLVEELFIPALETFQP